MARAARVTHAVRPSATRVRSRRRLHAAAVRGSGERLPDGSEFLQVDTYPATITALAAIKELNAKLREKDAEIAELRARLERIEQRVTK